MSFRSLASKRPINIYHRVSTRVGWIALFGGESQGKALERILPELNAQNYRVAFIIPDQLSTFGRIFNPLLLIITLGFYGRSQNLLIIGE